MLSGVIFVGTPHVVSIDSDSQVAVRQMFQFHSQSARKTSVKDSDIVAFCDNCREFQELGLQVPILSIYETAKTHIRVKGFHRNLDVVVSPTPDNCL